jgi:hypothetical protein
LRLLASIFFLFIAGALAGAIFTVQTLIGLLALVLVAYAGGGADGVTIFGGLVTTQLGYFIGVVGRGAWEWTGLSGRGTRTTSAMTRTDESDAGRPLTH